VLTGNGLRAAMCDQGYAVCRSVVDVATLRRLRSEAAALIADFYSGSRSGPDYWSYALEGRATPVLYRIHRLEQQPGLSAIPQLFASGSLRMLATAALGERAYPTVCAAVVKIPGAGAPVPWHRDRDHDGVGPGQSVNVSLYLDASTISNGCLEVVPRSQGLAPGADVDTWRQGKPVAHVTAGAGDATMHDVRLVHGSGPNPGDELCIRIVTEFRAESLSPSVLLGDA